MNHEHKLEMARTESMFREVNEEVARSAQRFEADEVEFLCECAESGCAERVTAGLGEYESVRAHPTRFLVVPGHQRTEIETVVEDRTRFSVVEKVERTVAETARRLNPRAAPA